MEGFGHFKNLEKEKFKKWVIYAFDVFAYPKILLQLHGEQDIVELRKKMAIVEFKNLEEVLSSKHRVSRDEAVDKINAIKPDLIERYNSLAEKIKNPNIQYEEYVNILEEADALLAEVRNL